MVTNLMAPGLRLSEYGAMTTSLSSLMGKANREIFLTENWPHSPFAVHDLSFESVRDFKELSSVEALLAKWKGPVQAHLPDVRDEASSVDATPSDAKKLYESGMALLFNNVEAVISDLKSWIAAIKADLGLPQMTYGRSIVYATPDGKGTAAHFDQNINFVLQLQGTKVWRLAPNLHVANPTDRHTLGLPMAPELLAYSHPLPNELSEVMVESETLEITLKPGSLLFVPRGYWHSTSAQGEALALNFTYNQPTWADLFTVALKSRLTLSPEWRELADGVSSMDSARRQQAEARFNSLLLELVDDLPNWQAADILGATEGQ